MGVFGLQHVCYPTRRSYPRQQLYLHHPALVAFWTAKYIKAGESFQALRSGRLVCDFRFILHVKFIIPVLA
jgi:hypothetical protein